MMRQRFGVAWDSSYAVSGILGLGYGAWYNLDYNNVLDSLVQYDLINAPIFSVALGPIGAGTSIYIYMNVDGEVLSKTADGLYVGEIVFGGVNIGRYTGYLHPVPVWPPVSEQPLGWVQ